LNYGYTKTPYLVKFLVVILSMADQSFNSWPVVALNYDAGIVKSLAISMLKYVDLYFIAMGLQIIASSTYKLFINENIKLPKAFDTQSFAELKQSLIRIGSIVLLIFFLEQAVQLTSSRDLLEYGLAIAAIIAAFSYSIHR
jgi:uncharacterized membrane protein YqhA